MLFIPYWIFFTVYMPTYMHTHMHAYMHSHMNTYVLTHMHAYKLYMHTYMHICVHIYMHTYMHSFLPSFIHSGDLYSTCSRDYNSETLLTMHTWYIPTYTYAYKPYIHEYIHAYQRVWMHALHIYVIIMRIIQCHLKSDVLMYTCILIYIHSQKQTGSDAYIHIYNPCIDPQMLAYGIIWWYIKKCVHAYIWTGMLA